MNVASIMQRHMSQKTFATVTDGFKHGCATVNTRLDLKRGAQNDRHPSALHSPHTKSTSSDMTMPTLLRGLVVRETCKTRR